MREQLKALIDNIPEQNIEPLFSLVMRFVEEADPLPDEIEALNNPDTEYVAFNVSDYM